ncbi:hypothetical protein, partial [Thiomicrorhabdus heinhorstiae]|uniref:hypothetical protein n=1 Tax=Thiomicrorhabdus heinhorstiae TaxID=2748010 RepID=UPI001E44F242
NQNRQPTNKTSKTRIMRVFPVVLYPFQSIHSDTDFVLFLSSSRSAKLNIRMRRFKVVFTLTEIRQNDKIHVQ